MTKFHKSVGRVQFVVFEKLTSAYLNQTAWEIMFLFNNLHEKKFHRTSRLANFDSVRYL